MKKRQAWRRYIGLLSCVLLCAVILTSTSCGRDTAVDPLAYLEMPFTCEVRGELSGMAFSGTLTLSSAANGGQEFCFTAPGALAGITLRRAGGAGERSVSLGQMRIPADGWGEAELFRLLLPLTRGRVLSIGRDASGDGVTAVIEAAEGVCYTVTTDTDGRPVYWESDGMWMAAEGNGADSRKTDSQRSKKAG